jgi:ribosome maturation factor RimP
MIKPAKTANISSLVYSIAKPLADELGFEIWDIKFLKEGSNWYLRIFIDNDSGITLEDCEKMSHAIDEPLDKLDPIPQSYFLEVCSPGIERELTKEEHFEKFIGSDVKIKLIRPSENGEKEMVGKLLSFSKDEITLETPENGNVITQRKNISHVNLKY